jgi:hypothetical protein
MAAAALRRAGASSRELSLGAGQVPVAAQGLHAAVAPSLAEAAAGGGWVRLRVQRLQVELELALSRRSTLCRCTLGPASTAGRLRGRQPQAGAAGNAARALLGCTGGVLLLRLLQEGWRRPRLLADAQGVAFRRRLGPHPVLGRACTLLRRMGWLGGCCGAGANGERTVGVAFVPAALCSRPRRLC